MLRRIWIGYRVELAKAVRQRFTYVGPVLVVAAVLLAILVHPVSRDQRSDYDFIAFATPMALNLLGLLLLLTFCAGQVSFELGSGSIRTLLVRPLLRHEFIAAKLLLGGTYALCLTLLTAGTSWGIAYALGDVGGVEYGGEVLYTDAEMVTSYLIGVALALAPQAAVVAYATMMSTLTRSTGAAVGSAIGLWLLMDMGKHALGVAPFLFSSYVETPWQVFAGHCDGLESAWFPSAGYCLLTSGAACVVFVSTACFVLSRRNLTA